MAGRSIVCHDIDERKPSDESRGPGPVRPSGGPPDRGGRAARAEGRRGPDPGPRHDRHPDRHPCPGGIALPVAVPRPAAAAAVGAGGGAVQLGKHLGAHVTAVCNTKNVELVRSLGADDVVDYLHEDFTKRGETWDAIIDAVGKYSFRRGRRALRPRGVYIATDGGRFYLETLALLVATRFVGSRKVHGAIGRRIKDDVLLLKELIEAGQVPAVIDPRVS